MFPIPFIIIFCRNQTGDAQTITSPKGPFASCVSLLLPKSVMGGFNEMMDVPPKGSECCKS